MNRLWYHVVAFLVVAVWGSTFVFTKLLLLGGLTAAQIFVLRFIVAYVLLGLLVVTVAATVLNMLNFRLTAGEIYLFLPMIALPSSKKPISSKLECSLVQTVPSFTTGPREVPVAKVK